MFGLFEKKKRPIPYTKYNEEMSFVGISFDGLVEIKDEKKLANIVKNSIDNHIKKVSKSSNEDLDKMIDDVFNAKRTDLDIRPDLKKLWAPNKQKILYSELTRLYKVLLDEKEKRKTM